MSFLIFSKWKQEQIGLGNLQFSKTRNKGEVSGKWKDKYLFKKNYANQIELEFTLTFDEYLYKCFEVGMKCPSDIGVKKDQYQLSRIGDLGGYTIDNCRFLTKLENQKERDSHVNQSEVVRNSNLKRVKEGTYHLLKIAPWKNPNANSNSLQCWKIADKIIEKHEETNWRERKLVKYFNLPTIIPCRNVLTKYKKGWNPIKDKDWMSWRVL